MTLKIVTSTVADGNLSFLWGEKTTVVNNRVRFLEKNGVESKKTVVMSIENKNIIVDVADANSGKSVFDPEFSVTADALVTDRMETYLFLLIADCIPLVLSDVEAGVIALAHVGWQSVDQELIKKLVKHLADRYQLEPAKIKAYIGPHIHPESYIKETPQQADDPRWQPFVKKVSDKDWQIDIEAFAKQQLLAAGIKEDSIATASEDTARDLDYFSHVRSKKTGEKEGRFAVVVGLK